MKNLFTVLLSLLVLTGCDEQPQSASSALVDKALPKITVQELAFARPVTLPLQSKPTVINIWATWCPPCIKELPDLLALQQQGEFDVITIATDREAATVTEFLGRYDWLDLNVWHDPMGRSSRDAWQARQLPLTLVVDATGTVRQSIAGVRDWDHPDMIKRLKQWTE